MSKALTSKIHAEIGAVIEEATKAQVLVRVYAEAEKIRQANISDNVALEDIVEEIIAQSADGPGYEANPGEAAGAILGNSASSIRSLQ